MKSFNEYNEGKLSDIKKKLSKIKGINKDQLQVLQNLPMPVITSIVNQLSMIVSDTELEEAPLVMNDMDMATALFKDIKDKMMKNNRQKNREKNWPILQQLASMAGYGITKKGQSKEKSFRYDLKKK